MDSSLLAPGCLINRCREGVVRVGEGTAVQQQAHMVMLVLVVVVVVVVEDLWQIVCGSW